jgi:hypothetical protein
MKRDMEAAAMGSRRWISLRRPRKYKLPIGKKYPP